MFRLARLLTALLPFTLLTANGASAITIVSAEKPASGLFSALEQRVGIDALATVDRIDEKLLLLYDFASDFPVAAKAPSLVVGSGARSGAITVAQDALAGAPSVFGRVSALPLRTASVSSVSLEGLPYTALTPQAFREAARVLTAGGQLAGSTGRGASLSAIRSGLQQAGFRDITVGYDIGDAVGNYRVIFSGVRL